MFDYIVRLLVWAVEGGGQGIETPCINVLVEAAAVCFSLVLLFRFRSVS